MKKEDIEKAAFNYGCENQVAPCMGGELEKGFIAGAEWRINSVWHDASEKPDNGKMVLTIDYIGHTFVCGPNNTEWEEASLIFNVSKWAYIEDLIPNNE